VVAWRLLIRLLPACWLEGAVDRRPYEAQYRVWRCLVPVRLNSVGDGAAVPEVALQWRCSGWDGRIGLIATEKTVPAGLTSRCSPM
jgi:hypothetical protein